MSTPKKPYYIPPDVPRATTLASGATDRETRVTYEEPERGEDAEPDAAEDAASAGAAPAVEFGDAPGADEAGPVLTDTYVGGSQEEEELRKWRQDQARERLLDRTTDAELRKAMSLLMARIDHQDKILRQIGRNMGGIVFPEGAAEGGFAAMERELKRQMVGKTKLKVLIHTSEKLNENFAIELRVNGNPPPGYPRGVPRGQVVELPPAYVEVLQHAIVSGYQRIVAPDGDPRTVFVHQLRYPFTILT